MQIKKKKKLGLNMSIFIPNKKCFLNLINLRNIKNNNLSTINLYIFVRLNLLVYNITIKNYIKHF